MGSDNVYDFTAVTQWSMMLPWLAALIKRDFWVACVLLVFVVVCFRIISSSVFLDKLYKLIEVWKRK